jgi:uncharacterized protein YggE
MYCRAISRVVGLLCALFALAGVTSAQSIQVDQKNRTIELSAQSSIEVEADIVSITVGYHNWGETHDLAYSENMRFADQILKTWTDAGVAQKDIVTAELTSNPVADDDLNAMPAAERKERRYEAKQSWTIVAKPEVAQKLLDLAVAAGANEVSNPSWELTDDNAAEAKAYASALEQARAIAEQMAKSFGGKVGPLLYASNQTRAYTQLLELATSAEMSGSPVVPRNWPPLHPVKLLPQKITKTAYVRAIFALE